MDTGLYWAWPWLILALPLPILVRWWLPKGEYEVGRPLIVPFYAQLAALPNQREAWVTPKGRLWLAVVVWLLLVTAACRPQWLYPPEELPLQGRELMLVVDLSGSMELDDFELNGQRVSRLEAVKATARQFVRRRSGDRVGLILFATRPYLLIPLTYDLTTVDQQLAETALGMAGDKTAIGDALGLAVKRMRGGEGQQAIILLTDGANNSGELLPKEAAQLAAQKNIRLYTIGIGSHEPVPVSTVFGTRMLRPDSELDEKNLLELAEIAGGKYFRAMETDHFANIYHLLDQLEPRAEGSEALRPVGELYPWPLAGALFLAMVMVAMTVLPPLWHAKGWS